jgi:hypothetical protein
MHLERFSAVAQARDAFHVYLSKWIAPVAELNPIGVQLKLHLLRFLIVGILQELKNEVRRFGILLDCGASAASEPAASSLIL